MSKVLLLLAVVGLALWWFKRSRDRQSPPAPPPRPRPPSAPGRGSEPAAMVACAHCGLHLPQADALTDEAGRPYCGEAHRRAGPR